MYTVHIHELNNSKFCSKNKTIPMQWIFESEKQADIAYWEWIFDLKSIACS